MFRVLFITVILVITGCQSNDTSMGEVSLNNVESNKTTASIKKNEVSKKKTKTKFEVNFESIFPRLISQTKLNNILAKKNNLYVSIYSSEGNLHYTGSENASIDSTLLEKPEHEPIVSFEINDKLSFIYVIDEGEHQQIISSSHLNEMGVSFEDMKAIAINNIEKYALSNETICEPIATNLAGYCMNNGRYESSMFLSKDFMSKIHKKSKSESKIYLYLVSNNIFIYGLKIPSSPVGYLGVMAASKAARQVNKEPDNIITKEAFIYSNGKLLALGK